MYFIYLHKKIIYKNLLKSFIYLLKKNLLKKKHVVIKRGKTVFIFFKGCHEVPTYPAIRRSNRT